MNELSHFIRFHKMIKEIISITDKSNLDVEEMLVLICEKISNVYKAERVSIVNFREIPVKDFILAEYKQAKVKSLKDSALFCNKILDYWILQLIDNDKITAIDNLFDFDMPEDIKSVYKSVNIKSLIGVPINIGDNKQGILFLYAYNSFKSWTENEIITLQMLKEHISIIFRRKILCSREKFLADVSHELKTPISIINSYTEALINRDKYKSEMSEKFLGVIKNNTERLIKILDEILYLSSLENIKEDGKHGFPQEKLISVIESAVKLCKEKADSKNIKINMDCNELIQVKVNSLLMQQALINLINNSINYSENGTYINISSKENSEEILISVQDDGCGISEEHQADIFQRFYRVDDFLKNCKTRGFGLGLSIVRKIVEFHGGYISLDSKQGKGSIFTIHLLKEE